MLDQEEDDGFNDFLDDEEEEANTLEIQELNAIHRRLKTAGVREGIEEGKEETLQSGFDHGFERAAKAHFQLGLLRGTLSTARAHGLLESLSDLQRNRLDELVHTLELKTTTQTPAAATDPARTRAPDASTTLDKVHKPVDTTTETVSLLHQVGLHTACQAIQEKARPNDNSSSD